MDRREFLKGLVDLPIAGAYGSMVDQPNKPIEITTNSLERTSISSESGYYPIEEYNNPHLMPSGVNVLSCWMVRQGYRHVWWLE